MLVYNVLRDDRNKVVEKPRLVFYTDVRLNSGLCHLFHFHLPDLHFPIDTL